MFSIGIEHTSSVTFFFFQGCSLLVCNSYAHLCNFCICFFLFVYEQNGSINIKDKMNQFSYTLQGQLRFAYRHA